MSTYKRILVVANETVAGTELHDDIKRLAAEDAAVKIVVPALNTRLRHAVSDIDQARAEAGQRLDRSLELLKQSGIEATGEIGETDPAQAFEDQAAIFEPDAVIVSTHPDGRSHWLEDRVVERIRERADVPVMHVVVDISHAESGVSAPSS